MMPANRAAAFTPSWVTEAASQSHRGRGILAGMSVLNTWAEAADMHESVGSLIVAASATTTCSHNSES